MTVLDFVRYHRHLKGTKIGCREGDCGACTVLVGELQQDKIHYQTMTCCLMPLSNARGKHIVTIEGINPPDDSLTPVQNAIVEENGTQCGFCTVGFVMSLTCYCLAKNGDTTEEAISAMDGNICRCTGYKSLERAANRITLLMNSHNGLESISFAIEKKIIPPYFSEMPLRLSAIASTNQPPIHHPMIVSGGTDLFVQRPDELKHADFLPVFDTYEMKKIRENDDYIEIGGSVTVTDLYHSPLLQSYFPRLHRHLKLVSSTPIRNMATVAGNLVNASPIGDLTIWFLALDATVVLQNGDLREVALKDFYQGYKIMDKTPDEIVEKIYFRKPSENAYFNFEKVSKRTSLDIATVNTAILLNFEAHVITDVHISAGGVAPIPLYLKNLSSCLSGKTLPFDEKTTQELDYILQSEISPISDVRGSKEYKRLLMRQLFHTHFQHLPYRS